MLLAEFARDSTNALPIYSQRISLAILRVGRALDTALDDLDNAGRATLWSSVREQLMPSLLDAPGADGFQSVLPWPYQKSCISESGHEMVVSSLGGSVSTSAIVRRSTKGRSIREAAAS